MKNQKEIIEREFAALGFSLIYWNDKPNANGIDCFVQKRSARPLSVEIKTLRKNTRTRAMSVEPVGNQSRCDLIAIIINTEYVLIEPMEQHLKCCGPKGWRPLTMLR